MKRLTVLSLIFFSLAGLKLWTHLPVYHKTVLLTDNAQAALKFSKDCYKKTREITGVKEFTFGAWALECRWRE